MLKKIVVSTAVAIAAGTLAFGASGIADAATPVPSSGHVSHHNRAHSTQVPKVGNDFNCAHANQVLAKIQAHEARIAAGLPKVTAAAAKAEAAGQTQRATELRKEISRQESASFKSRLDNASLKIETRCHVPAPTTPTTSTT